MPVLRLLGSASPLYIRMGAAAGCTAVADWLLYRHALGLSLVLFLGFLAGVSVWLNPPHTGRRPHPVAWLAFGAGQLAILEDPNPLSITFGLIGLAALVLIAHKGSIFGWRTLLALSAFTIVSGPVRFVLDCLLLGKLVRRAPAPAVRRGAIVTWIVPLVLGMVFLLLFREANPLIARWVQFGDLQSLTDQISIVHILFWVFVFEAIWPAIHVRIPRSWPKSPTAAPLPGDARPYGAANLFGETAVTRSLILFNLLFAMESALDLAYLWAGAKLPDGTTYAAYAHSGAYPLMATALLAGAFVLLAMRSAGTVPLVRVLLLAWTGQTVLLVLSSILRLNIYVAAYSLTEWRIAAFLWMALVAIGLCLIVIRIVRDRTSAWLVTANAAALALTLYGCCFVDFSSTIARYNVRHARECGGSGPLLDIAYLESLAPHALLAFDECASRLDWASADLDRRDLLSNIVHSRNAWVARYLSEIRNWRSWNFRSWRLDRTLAYTHHMLPLP